MYPCAVNVVVKSTVLLVKKGGNIAEEMPFTMILGKRIRELIGRCSDVSVPAV